MHFQQDVTLLQTPYAKLITKRTTYFHVSLVVVDLGHGTKDPVNVFICCTVFFFFSFF